MVAEKKFSFLSVIIFCYNILSNISDCKNTSITVFQSSNKERHTTTKETKWYFVFYSKQVLYEKYLRQHDQHSWMCMFQ